MGIAFMVMVLGGFLAWAIAAGGRQAEQRKTALGQIADHLRGSHDGSSASGESHGVAVTFRYATRGSGSSSESWTEIDAEVPRAYPLSIHVRRHAWRDRARIASGEMIDIQLGDAAFDDAFLVEAAPADVVRLLLDQAARSFLAAQPRVELDTVEVGGRRVLRLSLHGWIEQVPAATAAIAAAAQIGARVREAYAAVDRSAVQEQGSPYRPMLDDQPARDAAAARSHEVATVEAIRTARIESGKIVAGVVFATILFIMLAALCH